MNKSAVKRREDRPWGSFEVIEEEENYWIKKIFVRAGEALSLQSHENRSEIWVVIEGEIEAQKNDNKVVLSSGECIKIEKREKHRIRGIRNTLLVEIALGSPKEEDIIRYEDSYGRV